jgi:pimeloyl-ACP methyl ester carboxylesterase
MSLASAANPPNVAAALQPVACPAQLASPGRVCERLAVPLEAGAVPGHQLDLFATMERASGTRRGAVVVLAGGPGQSATAHTHALLDPIDLGEAPEDIVVLDIRGTGRSGAITCARLQADASLHSTAATIDCARGQGANLSHYTTVDHVRDIDALRSAIGDERIALYGVSYGARLALAYARSYPNRVRWLLLDSVPPSPSVSSDTFRAMRRVLPRWCRSGCGGPRVVTLATALASQLRATPLTGTSRDAHGQARPVALTADRLYDLLLAGDLNDALRAAAPSAIVAASRGDTAALLRVAAAARESGRATPSPRSFSAGLYAATTCGDVVAGFGEARDPGSRLAMARAGFEAQGPRGLRPFDSATALEVSPFALCASWPFPGASPGDPDAPLPPVPALVISGDEDLRAPLESATAVASRLSAGTLLRVAGGGHAVLASEETLCADRAARHFVLTLEAPRRPCSKTNRAMAVPVPPRALRALRPVRGVPRPVGRVLRATALTLDDAALAEALNVGGLRRGWVTPAGRLRSYEYVPGLRINATARSSGRALAVRLSGIARGRLVVRRDGGASGRVGRTQVRARLSLTWAVDLFE